MSVTNGAPTGEDDGSTHSRVSQAESDAAESTAATPSDKDSLTDDAMATWRAARAFARAARGFAMAMVGLARSEWQLALASWPLVFAILVVLVGLSLSLWASVIALAGWGFYVLTGSVGWALAALIGLHVALLVSARIALRRTSRHMTMPATRRELHGLAERVRGTRKVD